MAVRDVVQAAAGVGGGDKLYVEDVFSTYLYTGNGSTQTITNGIDLAGEGGLVWTKQRNGTIGNYLFDSARGFASYLQSNSTGAAATASPAFVSATSSGFSVDAGFGSAVNGSGNTYASWTFRKAPKFFDVVTYTGSSSTQNIPHNLGSVPGMIIVKRINLSEEWFVYHRSLGASLHLKLNDADFAGSSFQPWNNTAPTDSVFTVLGGRNEVNNTGSTYVAYLFAHDAGGFGDDGLQNVISCGSYTGNGSTTGPVINLGWEPQWILVKKANGAENWVLIDNMRGINASVTPNLFPNLADAETSSVNTDYVTQLLATGFQIRNVNNEMNTNGGSYIYIAIRRPMKTPESGTEVFAIGTSTSDSSGYTLTSNFPVDSYLFPRRDAGSHGWVPRLTNGRLQTDSTSTEADVNGYVFWDSNVNVRRTGLLGNASTVDYALRRAPGFFDVVAYTGDATIGRAVPHNLTVAPELIILKNRSLSGGGAKWVVASSITAPNEGSLSSSNGFAAYGNITAFGSTTFTLLNGASEINNSSYNYIAYLFASCPGVSKVGSYVGDGTSSQTIDCGFSNGARFVLWKNTTSSSAWEVADTARGIVTDASNPIIDINDSISEQGSTAKINPTSSGFIAKTNWNQSGQTYIFLAIA